LKLKTQLHVVTYLLRVQNCFC